MRKLIGLSLVGFCVMGLGCAAQTDDPSEFGSEVEADTQALEKGRLLALGDSIAFGYNPFGDFTKDKNFKGYPEALESEFSVKNSACPGETSASFLSNAAPDNGCRAYRAAYPLHVNYGDNATQMDYALDRVTSEEAEDVPTQITLNISGNDIFLVQAQCAMDPQGPAACFTAHVPALIGSIATNVATILGTLRGAGYTGPITYMNLYATDYSVPSTVAFLNALNGAASAQARAFGAKIANAFGAFQTAAGTQSPCAAGLLIPKPTGGGCDVHPSAAGTQVLAQSVRVAQ
jgi:lysophospholipase L1-like esterase